MKQKKIICTVTNDLNYDQRMIRICSSLVDAGFDVELIGRNKKKSPPLFERKFQQKRLNCFFQSGKFFYVEYNIRLFFYLLFADVDIINAIDLDTILPGYFISRIRSKKIVYDAHEYFTEVPEVVSRPNIQKIWKKIEKSIVPRIEHAYTVCESLAELFYKEYKVPFEVIRNVPFKNEDVHYEKEKRIILYQGALNEGRGLEAMIAAMEDVEGAELWLAGEGDLSEALRTLVQEKKLEHKITFLGFLQPEDLTDLTNKVYVGLNLLENKGLSYYYSLANKTFDYIQALVPGIHMAFPEYKKLNEKYNIGVLIKTLEKEDILKAIQTLLNDEVYYLQLKENCRQAKEELTWEKEVEKLLDVYQKL